MGTFDTDFGIRHRWGSCTERHGDSPELAEAGWKNKQGENKRRWGGTVVIHFVQHPLQKFIQCLQSCVDSRSPIGLRYSQTWQRNRRSLQLQVGICLVAPLLREATTIENPTHTLPRTYTQRIQTEPHAVPTQFPRTGPDAKRLAQVARVLVSRWLSIDHL